MLKKNRHKKRPFEKMVFYSRLEIKIVDYFLKLNTESGLLNQSGCNSLRVA